MSKRIEELSMWGEYEMEKRLEDAIAQIMMDKESGRLKEDEQFGLVVDDDGSAIFLTLKSLDRFPTAGDILKHYKDSLVERLYDHRLELELDKEERKESKNYLIN
jgi:hypothetical protein